MTNRRQNAGFTLVELMVTMLLAAIVLSYGVPNFRTLILKNRQASQMNNFLTAMMLARSEAIKRHNDVTLCKSADGQTCVADNGATGWQQGWIVFDDPDFDRVVDAGETIIRVYDGFDSNATLRGNANVDDNVTYMFTGLVRGGVGAAGSIVYCDERVPLFANNPADARVLILSSTGRARVLPGDDPAVPGGLAC